MKKRTVIIGMILSVLVFLGVPCNSDAHEIYGCSKKINGQLRIVDNLSQCQSSENPISWNQTGPPGVTIGSSRIVSGAIDGDGTILSGAGFTVVRVQHGYYTVSFQEAFESHPHCTASVSAQEQGNRVAVLWLDGNEISGYPTMVVQTYRADGGTAVTDWRFMFICTTN